MFKFMFQGLWKRKYIYILITLLITFGMMSIIETINFFYNYNFVSKNCLLNKEQSYFLNNKLEFEEAMTFESKYSKDRLMEVLNFLYGNDYFEDFGTYEVVNLNFNIPFRVKTSHSQLLGLKVDEGLYNILDIKLIGGSALTKEYFSSNPNGPLKVLVGSEYKKYYKIRDILNDKYEIKGFIEKDKYLFDANKGNAYVNINKAFLIPVKYNDIYRKFSDILQGGIVKLRDGKTLDEINALLTENYPEFKFYLKNVKVSLDERISSVIEIDKFSISMSLIFSLLSIISIVITSSLSVLMRKREFGIRLALGESNKMISVQVFIENLFVSILGGILNLIITKIRYQEIFDAGRDSGFFSLITMRYNFIILFVYFLIIFIMVLFSNILFSSTINKLSPKELIGGAD